MLKKQIQIHICTLKLIIIIVTIIIIITQYNNNNNNNDSNSKYLWLKHTEVEHVHYTPSASTRLTFGWRDEGK